MEKSKKAEHKNKIVCSYIFKDDINRVYECFANPEIFHTFINQAEDIALLKGKNYGEIGTKAKFSWKGKIEISYSVVESINTPNYKKIMIHAICSKPIEMNYWLNWHFMKNTNDNSTLFMHDMIFQNAENMKYIDCAYDLQEKQEMYKKIETYLANSTKGLRQFESLLIKNSIEVIWSTITNWKELSKIAPNIADKVTYKGDKYSIGTKIFVEDSLKKTSYTLQIVHVDDEDEFKKRFCLEVLDDCPKIPSQKLIFEFVKINSTNTFVSLEHLFTKPIKHDLIYSISKNKTVILSEIKKKLEEEKEEN